MIKLYIFDADGTLCSRDTGELLPNTLERIKALPKGSHIAIATNQGGVGLRHWMEVDGFGEPEKFPTAFEVFDMYSKVAEQIGCAAENTFYSFAYQSKKTGKWSPTPDGAESHPFWRKDWRKPDAGMINTAVIASGVADKSSVVFVGDSKEGKEAAEKAEVRFIYANDFFWESVMPWEKIIPASSGQHGGRKPTPPSARLDRKNKLLMLNKSAGELLGNPPRVVVEADRQRQAIRLSPAVEDDQSAYVFSGGGNSPRRIRAAEIMKKIEHDGHFEIKKKSGKIVLQVK